MSGGHCYLLYIVAGNVLYVPCDHHHTTFYIEICLVWLQTMYSYHLFSIFYIIQKRSAKLHLAYKLCPQRCGGTKHFCCFHMEGILFGYADYEILCFGITRLFCKITICSPTNEKFICNINVHLIIIISRGSEGFHCRVGLVHHLYLLTVQSFLLCGHLPYHFGEL